MRNFILLSSAVILLAVGCGGKKQDVLSDLPNLSNQKATDLPTATGGFVLAVGGETITSGEIVAETAEYLGPAARKMSFKGFQKQGRQGIEQILSTKIANIVLYGQAKAKGGEQMDEQLEKLARTEMLNFIARFGGDTAKAEAALKQQGMNWETFKEYQKKMMLSQSYIASKMPEQRPVTYSELLDRYHSMKDDVFSKKEMIQFQLIDIQPSKLQQTDPNINRMDLAKTIAYDLLTQVNRGAEFGKLAKEHSHGHLAKFGGLWKPVQPQSLAEPYDVLADQAKKIEPGDIAGPIEAGEHVFIMKLIDKQDKTSQPFEDVQHEIEAQILFERRKEAVDKLSTKLAQQTVIVNKNAFIEFCLKEVYSAANE